MRFHYTITTYRELREWAAKFAKDSNLHSLVIFGSPGTGKTETLMRAMQDEYLVPVKGRLTAFQLFCLIKQHVGALFLFDDTRRILKDFECVNLLMALGEHKSPKIIQWNTAMLNNNHSHDDDSDESDNPNEVWTTSRLVVVINRVDEDDENLEPLFSRSIVLRFSPSKLEVHKYVGEWFPKDRQTREIYEFIGSHLSVIPVADVRDYTKSATIHDMDWRAQLLQAWSGDEYLSAAMQIINDPSIAPGKAQVDTFGNLCGGSRAQFFRLKSRLMPMGSAPEADAAPDERAESTKKPTPTRKSKKNGRKRPPS